MGPNSRLWNFFSIYFSFSCPIEYFIATNYHLSIVGIFVARQWLCFLFPPDRLCRHNKCNKMHHQNKLSTLNKYWITAISVFSWWIYKKKCELFFSVRVLKIGCSAKTAFKWLKSVINLYYQLKMVFDNAT